MTVSDRTALASSDHQPPSLAVASQHPCTVLAGVAVFVVSILCGLATYLILSRLAPVKPDRELIAGLMAANLVLVALMAGMIGWQIWKLVQARSHGIAGAGLH